MALHLVLILPGYWGKYNINPVQCPNIVTWWSHFLCMCLCGASSSSDDDDHLAYNGFTLFQQGYTGFKYCYVVVLEVEKQKNILEVLQKF